MSHIPENINAFLKELEPYDAQLVAVSKTKTPENIMEAYHTGFRSYGENKVQELVSKADLLPDDIEWHMIGHLQRNKVKYIAPFVHLIHSIDSLRLLKEVDKQGKNTNRRISCLMQMHIAEESTKFGLSKQELFEILEGPEIRNMENIRIRGLMGMATNTDDDEVVRREFHSLKSVFDQARLLNEDEKIKFEVLSMGMSSDYQIALEEGSTMVRVGSSIFGARS